MDAAVFDLMSPHAGMLKSPPPFMEAGSGIWSQIIVTDIDIFSYYL